LLLALSACSPSGATSKTELMVFAASSLTESFTELARAFERRHPEARVTLSLAGSQALRLQIAHGAPADIFASANPQHLQASVAAGHVTDARRFAHNTLVVITPPSNPAGINAWADLGRATRVVLGAPQVPAGRYARQVLGQANATLRAAVTAHTVSEEPNVRLVQAKVQLGEADAALVYRSDAVAAGAKVRVIPIPPAINVAAEYMQGRVTHRPHPELAQAWLAFVNTPEGQAILARHGFDPR
jgi:molybdate transport system substrate-binding protein